MSIETDGVRDEHGRLVAPVDANGGRCYCYTNGGKSLLSASHMIRLTTQPALPWSRLTSAQQKQMQFVRVDDTSPFTLEGDRGRRDLS